MYQLDWILKIVFTPFKSFQVEIQILIKMKLTFPILQNFETLRKTLEKGQFMRVICNI